MSDNNQQRKPQPWLVFDDPKIALFAVKQDMMEKKPKLSVGIYENNPRLRVRTQVPNDKNNGYIDAAMSAPAFWGLLQAIEALARAKDPNVIMVDNLGHPFINQQRSKDKLPMSRTRVEKHEDGMITLSITAGKSRPVIEFPFMLDEYHHFLDGNGNPMPVAIASKIACLGWVEMVSKLMAAELSKHTAKPEWMNRNQGQGQGGYNQNSGYQQNQNGGGYNQSRQSSGGYNQNQGGNASYSQGNNNQQQSAAAYSFDEDVPL